MRILNTLRPGQKGTQRDRMLRRDVAERLELLDWVVGRGA